MRRTRFQKNNFFARLIWGPGKIPSALLRVGLEIGHAAQGALGRRAPRKPMPLILSRNGGRRPAQAALIAGSALPCPRHEASMVSGFRLASRARSLLSALT